MFVEEFEVASQKLVKCFVDLSNYWTFEGRWRAVEGLDGLSTDGLYHHHPGPLNEHQIRSLDNTTKTVHRELLYALPAIRTWKEKIISCSPPGAVDAIDWNGHCYETAHGVIAGFLEAYLRSWAVNDLTWKSNYRPNMDRTQASRLILRAGLERKYVLESYDASAPATITTSDLSDLGITKEPAHKSKNGKLWHSSSDSPPEGYHGPLTGRKSDLGHWFSPRSEDSRPQRILSASLKSLEIWGREMVRGKSYELYFKSEDKYHECLRHQAADHPR